MWFISDSIISSSGVVVIKGSSLFSNSWKAFANTPIWILFWIILLASVCPPEQGRECTKALWKEVGQARVRAKGGGEAEEEKKDGRMEGSKREIHPVSQWQGSAAKEPIRGRQDTQGLSIQTLLRLVQCVCQCKCVNMYFNLSLLSCQVKGTHTYWPQHYASYFQFVLVFVSNSAFQLYFTNY